MCKLKKLCVNNFTVICESVDMFPAHNLFHKLTGCDQSIFYNYWLSFVMESDAFSKHRAKTGVVIFQETGSAVC